MPELSFCGLVKEGQTDRLRARLKELQFETSVVSVCLLFFKGRSNRTRVLYKGLRGAKRWVFYQGEHRASTQKGCEFLQVIVELIDVLHLVRRVDGLFLWGRPKKITSRTARNIRCPQGPFVESRHRDSVELPGTLLLQRPSETQQSVSWSL